MKIILGSQNEPKRPAVEKAFSLMFPGEHVEVVAFKADSDVSDHPMGDETLRGAKNRAEHARLEHPGADYYVGIEGGLFKVGDKYWETGVIVIVDSNGRVGSAPSAGVELQGKLLESVLNGEELNDALLTHFNLEDLGKKNGYYGLVTDDVAPRDEVYVQGIVCAFAPFKHPEYFE